MTLSVLVGGKYYFGFAKNVYLNLPEYKKIAEVKKTRKNFVCMQESTEVKVFGGKVCKTLTETTSYQKIFETYPIESGGKEQIYKLLSQGSVEVADKILENEIPVERYEPVRIAGAITWEEDPYKEKYWRFLFYGFRPLKNLFSAYDQTYNIKYLTKIAEITHGFLDVGINKNHSWEDFHAVSFRTMYLVKIWWQLRENNLLTNDFNDLLLRTIEQHADFLADPNHYDKGYNHGLNEAAALYLVAVNFPDF